MAKPKNEESTGSREMTNQEWFLKLYRKIEGTESGLTNKIFDLALEVNTLKTKFEDLDSVSDSALMLVVAKHKEECRKEARKSGSTIPVPMFSPKALDHIKNPYTLGAGLVAIASAIAAAVEIFAK